MQMRRFRGSRTVTSLRLCSRAPWMTSSSAAISDESTRANRIEQVFAHRSLTVSSLIAHECWIPCCTVTARSTRRACTRVLLASCAVALVASAGCGGDTPSGAPAEPPLPRFDESGAVQVEDFNAYLESVDEAWETSAAQVAIHFAQPIAQENEQIGTTLGDADDGDTLAIVTVTGIGDDSVAARRTSVVLTPDGDGWRLVRAQWTQRCQAGARARGLVDRALRLSGASCYPAPRSRARPLRPDAFVPALRLGLAPAAEHEAAEREPEPEGAEREGSHRDRLAPQRQAAPVADRRGLLLGQLLPTPLLAPGAAGLEAEVEIVEDLGAVGHHGELYSLVRLVPASRTDTRPVVAAFDVDGTLTTGDRVTPFLWRVARWRLARTIARHPFGIAAALLRGDNDRLKALATEALTSVALEHVLRAAEPFAREIPGSVLRADTGARLRRHRELGHRVVLVSASYEVYLRPLGALLGVDGVIGTRLEVDASGRCTGRLDGPNCRGPEKLRRAT